MAGFFSVEKRGEYIFGLLIVFLGVCGGLLYTEPALRVQWKPSHPRSALSSEPPITPEIEKALQLQHTMDEISGTIHINRQLAGSEEKLAIWLSWIGVLGVITLGPNLLLFLQFTSSFAGWLYLAFAVGLPLICGTWAIYLYSDRVSMTPFSLTRTSLVWNGQSYSWNQIQRCDWNHQGLMNLTLQLKDSQQITLGCGRTAYNAALGWGNRWTSGRMDETSFLQSRARGNLYAASLQWLCELINHRAGLAGDEAEVPEDIKAMRRQKDSV